jgi:hypothetical protein
VASNDGFHLEVHGLIEFQNALKQVEGGLDREVRKALKAVAMGVVRRARSKMANPGGNAAMSIKAKATDKFVNITAGGTRAEYFPWLDFGGTTGRGHGPGGGGSIVRPWAPGGRYIYPAVAESSDEIGEQVTDVILDAAKRAGLDVAV